MAKTSPPSTKLCESEAWLHRLTWSLRLLSPRPGAGPGVGPAVGPGAVLVGPGKGIELGMTMAAVLTEGSIEGSVVVEMEPASEVDVEGFIDDDTMSLSWVLATNRSRTRLAPTPTYISSNSEPEA